MASECPDDPLTLRIPETTIFFYCSMISENYNEVNINYCTVAKFLFKDNSPSGSYSVAISHLISRSKFC